MSNIERQQKLFSFGELNPHAAALDPGVRPIALERAAKALNDVYKTAGVPEEDRTRQIDEIINSHFVEVVEDEKGIHYKSRAHRHFEATLIDGLIVEEAHGEIVEKIAEGFDLEERDPKGVKKEEEGKRTILDHPLFEYPTLPARENVARQRRFR